MKIIGVTGKSGSGKTKFALLLSEKLKCRHVHVDKIGHQALYQPEILDALCEKFGTDILDKDGKVNRKKVGNIVFANKEKMQELTDLTWNYMEQILDDMLLQDNQVIILDWILLPQTKYWNKCDYKILVEADTKQRKIKVLERDNISEEYFDKRDSASLDYSPFKFDYIFENDYKDLTMNNVIENVYQQFF